MRRGILTCDQRALKATTQQYSVFTAYFSTRYTLSMMAHRFPLTHGASTLLGIAVLGIGLLTSPSSLCASDDLHIEITKRGLGKEVVITQGAREWFMLIEVTPENSVVLRQEKDHDRYLVDESETHDRPMTTGEVDAAISDYVNSVKARATKK
jgi:hypothetical protein